MVMVMIDKSSGLLGRSRSSYPIKQCRQSSGALISRMKGNGINLSRTTSPSGNARRNPAGVVTSKAPIN